MFIFLFHEYMSMYVCVQLAWKWLVNIFWNEEFQILLINQPSPTQPCLLKDPKMTYLAFGFPNVLVKHFFLIVGRSSAKAKLSSRPRFIGSCCPACSNGKKTNMEGLLNHPHLHLQKIFKIVEESLN